MALATLALAGVQAEAARTRAVSPSDPAVHLAPAPRLSQGELDLQADEVDAERMLQGERAAVRVTPAPVATAAAETELNPLPSSDEFELPAAGEVRGRLLLQVMSDLPQVGAASSNPSLSLDFWDDAATARSAVDDRASVSAEAAGQANGRTEAHSNVMIPLPMAAWSGLSVLGGVGIVRGVRRLARGSR